MGDMPDAEAIEKIAEGHQQLQEARQADVQYVAQAHQLARWNLQRLEDDQEVLDRYGYNMPEHARTMLENSLTISKALEMSTNALGALINNDPVLTPTHRRGTAE